MGKAWHTWRVRGVHASHRHGALAHMREFMWPTMGLRAFMRWIWLKLLRQANQPHYVALGAALGVITAFFPILGTHLLIVAALCALLRASFVAGMLGTMVANPWTIGPMWAASFHLGRKILGMTPGNDRAIEHLNGLSWSLLMARLDILLDRVIMPTIFGGIVIGGPLAVLVYAVVYWQLRQRRVTALAKANAKGN